VAGPHPRAASPLFKKGFAGKCGKILFWQGKRRPLLITQKGEVVSLFEGKIGKMKIFLTTASWRVLGRF
jgi:hypothetical protein